MQKYIILLIALLSIHFSNSQTVTYSNSVNKDYVILNDGGRIVGTILTQELGKKLTIGTKDQSIWVIDWADIKSINHGKPPKWSDRYETRPVKLSSDKGYFNLTEFGILSSSRNNYHYGPGVAANISMINGYRLKHYLSTGLGLAINFFEEGNTIPLFLDIRGDILNKQVSPHYYLQGGYQFNLTSPETISQWWGNDLETDAEGGLVLGAGVGMHFHSRGNVSYLVSAGYRYQQSTYSQFDEGGLGFEEQINHRRIALQFGLMF